MISLLASSSQVMNLDLNIAWWHWVLLFTWFMGLILFDILVMHRKDHIPTIKRSIAQSIGWVGMGIALGAVIWIAYGTEAGTQYFSGYLVEKSLSIDNVFAWSLILAYFKIPKKYQHRVLFWGVIGAIVLRVIFVFAGIALIERFEPILLIFGLILLWSGLKLLRDKKDHEYDPRNGKFFRIVKMFIPISKHLDGHKLFTVENGKVVATMLFMALLVVEFTDVVFAVDSVPAILAVSRTPFIIIASNAAAILGMRALYFVFDLIKDKFWLLHYALGGLLLFIGLKMFVAPTNVFGYQWFDIHLSTNLSLIIICSLLTIGVVGSLAVPDPRLKTTGK